MLRVAYVLRSVVRCNDLYRLDLVYRLAAYKKVHAVLYIYQLPVVLGNRNWNFAHYSGLALLQRKTLITVGAHLHSSKAVVPPCVCDGS